MSLWIPLIDDFLASLRVAGMSRNTVRTWREQLCHLARRVSESPGRITTRQLVDYLDAQDCARETRRSRRVVLVAFFAWCVTEGIREDNPAVRFGVGGVRVLLGCVFGVLAGGGGFVWSG